MPTERASVPTDAPRTAYRPTPADAVDARFQGLPFGDGTARSFVADAPTADATRWADGYLARKGWAVHRIGRARYAHGPSGAHWIFGWHIAGEVAPAWLGRLAERATSRADVGQPAIEGPTAERS